MASVFEGVHSNQDLEDRDDYDRCCCECGDCFQGTLEDYYCYECWNSLGLGEIEDGQI